MDMTHITEFSGTEELQMDADLPLHLGAGAVDPELIEPVTDRIDIADLIAFSSL